MKKKEVTLCLCSVNADLIGDNTVSTNTKTFLSLKFHSFLYASIIFYYFQPLVVCSPIEVWLTKINLMYSSVYVEALK